MASSTGWINGLLTGNIPVRAQAKLESAGIWGDFDSDFSYFGNEALSRGAGVFEPTSHQFGRMLSCDRNWRYSLRYSQC